MVPGVQWLLVTEGVLGALAFIWAIQSGSVIPYSFDLYSLFTGVWMALLLTAVNFGLFFFGRRFDFAEPVYKLFEEEIFPSLGKASLGSLVLIAIVAGFSEELMFRGMLQPRMGLVAASTLFGFLHGPDYRLWALALWAALVGGLLGLVYEETENIVIPMLIHTVYDAIALMYIRWSSTRP